MPKRILFFSRVTAEPNARGNATYMIDVMRNLERHGFSVEFSLLETAAGEKPPAAWDAPPTKGELEYAGKRMEQVAPDFVMVNYAYLADILELDACTAHTIILTHDVCSLRGESFKKTGAKLDGTAWTKEREAAQLAKADMLIAIQQDEALSLKELAPEAKVVVVPMTAVPNPLKGSPLSGRCLFVGSDADHNRFSLLWFLKEVWPSVLNARPDATLSVCGTVNHRILQSYPNVTMHGRVEDLTTEYAEAEICLTPLRCGSGLEIKLIEALSYGKPCLVSGHSADVLTGICRKAVAYADGAEDYLKELVALMSSPKLQAALSRNALECVEQNFSAETLYEPLVSALSQLIRA